MGRLRCGTKSIPGSLVLRWMDCFPPKTTRKSDSEDFLETVFMERNYRYECRKHKNRYHRTGQHVLCHRKGFITHGGIDPTRITASARNRARLENNCKALGIHPGTTAEVAENSDIVIVGVIPTQVENVLREVRDLLPGKIIVSIAYGVSHQRYMELLPEGCHVICVVPNTPIEVGKGVLVCSNDHSLTEEQLEIFNELFGSIALIELLPPELLDLGGIVAGSTPAFMDIVIESLADAAVLHGMPRATAYRLVEKMMEGSAAYAMETGSHPAALKDGVCSPGGATIKGVATLETSGLRGALIQAIVDIMK